MIGIVYITINAKGLNPLHLLLAIVVCVISTFLVYLWGVFIFILTFWFKKMESTADLFYTIAAVSKYPLIFLPKQILLSFTYVIPIAFMGTIPAEIANGKIDFLELAWLPLLVVVTLLLISICWKLGRNRYESIN
jgi:ABC-2 type transport system permease protein